MNVMCFGDSNTYGYDPRSWLGRRYDADSRWADILAAETGWTVRNMGVNGREIPKAVPDMPPNTDLLVVMLAAMTYSRAAARMKPPGSWSVFSLACSCHEVRFC